MSNDLDQSPAVPFDLKADGPTFGFEKNYNPSGGTVPGGAPGQVQFNSFGTFGGLSNVQLTALIQLFTPSLSGVVPASGGGTSDFLRADGTWAVPPSGGGGITDGNKGDVTVSGSGTIWVINSGVVTYSKIQNVSTSNAILGRLGGTGSIQELTGTQTTTLLDVFTNSLKGIVPPSGGGTANFLRADGVWAAPPGGGGGGAVSSVSAADTTLTITPTTGAVTAALNLANHNTWATGQTFTRIFFGTADEFGLQDTSSLAHNSSTFWDSNMHRCNRLFVGLSATIDTNDVPQSGHVLSSTYNFAWSQNSQFAVTSAMGLNAATALSRASDWVTFSGTPSDGSQAFTGFGFNDDTTTVRGSITVGGNLIGIHLAGANGITIGTQNDINTARNVVIDPFTGFLSGTTISTLATSGAYSSAATQNPSAAYVINGGFGGGPVFNAGIVIMGGSLASIAGAKPVAIALPNSNAIVWYNSAGVKGGSLFVDGAGNFNITSSGGQLVFNGTPLTIP